MNSKALPFIPIATDLLGGICFLSLFLPWFFLGREAFNLPFTSSLFWRLTLILFLGREVNRHLGNILPYEKKKKSYLLALFISLLALLLIPFILFWPFQSFSHWFLMLFLGLIAWLYGNYWGKNPFDNYVLKRQLLFGCVNLALVFAKAKQMHLLEETLEFSLPFLIFWFLGIILATALTHLLDTGQDKSLKISYYSPLLISLASVTLLSAVILASLSPYLVEFFHYISQYLFSLVEQILLLIAYILSYLFQAIFYLIQLLLDRKEVKFQIPQIQDIGPLTFEGEEITREPLPEDIFRFIILALLILITMGITIFLLHRKREREKRKDPEEYRESYASPQVLKDWALYQLQDLLKNLKKKSRSLLSPFMGLENATQIYHALLDEMKKKGRVRPKSVTAHYFQKEIHKAYPRNQREADSILSSFTREYYQGVEVKREELNRRKEDLKTFFSEKK